MLQRWVEKGMFHVIEQSLVDQGNQIRKKQWLSESELEEIRRLIEEGEYIGEVGEVRKFKRRIGVNKK